MLIRMKHRKVWTAEEDDLIRRSFAEGRFLHEVARMLERSQESVRTRANLLKVSVRSAPRETLRLRA